MVILFLMLLGPDTEILVISEGCPPCVEAIRIIETLQNEGYDVVIVKKSKYRVTPTLIIREKGSLPKRIIGLQTEEKYRELISW